MSFCQFGNYLVQNMAEKGSDVDKRELGKIIVANIMEMSLDKFASNVVERSMALWHADYVEQIFEELSKVNKLDPSKYASAHPGLTCWS